MKLYDKYGSQLTKLVCHKPFPTYFSLRPNNVQFGRTNSLYCLIGEVIDDL